jgi:hypothetical protein
LESPLGGDKEDKGSLTSVATGLFDRVGDGSL